MPCDWAPEVSRLALFVTHARDPRSARLAGEREASVATPSADALSDDAGGVLAVHEDASVIGHGHGNRQGRPFPPRLPLDPDTPALPLRPPAKL